MEHLQGLRGQHIEWTGVDGGWYALVKDDKDDLQINVRTTAPLPTDFPDRQFITGVAVLSRGHSLVVEVKEPYTVDTQGCSNGVSPCLADGGLSISVDGELVGFLSGPINDANLPGGIEVSSSNLPQECREFGGRKVWARMCLRIWSRETGSVVPSRVSLLISILRLNLVLTYGIPPEFRGGVHL